ncbi:positive regulation of MHC class I biosynthetic process [Desmophyllum pertusum]|uniref:Positive regulation of MHC class I biosynthetic process n=1 Tax=Desmophyllum pertusum TaxID=174260 RepID=A0A9W9Z2N2_9CNID|nr:positive regulation of MHC class I biosynthetic process [Desmophyllum pertusum]
METLKDLFTAKTFNRVSYVAVICWTLFGASLLAIFTDTENSESRFDFRCGVKSENVDLVRGKCFEQYEKLYNKFSIPVYAFVIVNFSFIGIVCVIYSQIAKSRVDALLEANNSDAERRQLPNPRRKLFIAYCCQLATRFALGILFIVLQTQLLYPSSFPSNFNCHLTPGGSHAANSSGNIQNTTQSALYECHNQRASKKTFWTNAVSVVNGVFALLILIEVIYIMARAIKGENFMEDSQFLKDHLNAVLPQNPQQEPERQDLQQELNEQIQLLAPQEPERQDSQQELNEEIPLLAPQEPELPQEQPQQPSFIASMKKSIIEDTEQPTDLKGLFQTNPGEGERTKHLRLDQIYTNLVLHPDRAIYKFNTENREEQLKMYPKTRGVNLQPKRREDITDAENKNVLIVGRAGIGKTLFCTKFLRDWASERLFNEKFAVVFLLKLRKFNSVFETHLNLRELLNKSEYLRTDCPDEVWNYIRDNPHKVLLIFDGIDEFIDNSSIKNNDTNADFRNSEEEKMPLSALYEKVASGNLLRGATVLTTTRPGRVLSNIKHLQFKTFEILGFTSEQVDEYVQKFTEDDKCAGKKMLQHISSNINIYSLCYIPVNCFIICSCLLQELKFPSGSVGLSTKLTQIYKNATKFFFYKHVDKKFSNKSQEEIESDDLPPEMEEAEFKRLGEIAFNGIKDRRLIFGSKEVGQGLRDSALFHRLPDRRTGPFKHDEPQFCFIHLTMQEFFAAKHVTDTMSEAELRRFVADRIEKDEWHVVMQFVAGLLGDRDESSIEIFTDLLPVTIKDIEADEPICTSVTCWPTDGQQRRLALTLIKSIFEFKQSDSVVESKLEQIGFNAVDFSACGLAPVDCAAVVHVFKNVKQMDLSDNFIGQLGCIEIQKLLSSINCKLSSLDVRRNQITDEGIKHLSEALANSNCKLNSLYLSYNGAITDEGIKHLSEALTNSNCKLSSLGLNGICTTDEDIKHLSETLANSNCKLNSLYLSDNDAITDEGIKHLSEALANSNCKLNSLYLSDNDAITDEGIKHLSEALTNSNCKLNSLDLRDTQITGEGITHLSKALTNSNCKLNSLDLSYNDAITDEGIKHLSEALTNSNCKLNSLDLSGTQITDEGITHLSEALTNSNCKLKLGLRGTQITDEVLELICSEFQK